MIDLWEAVFFLNEDLNDFFQQASCNGALAPQARCLLQALHLIRVHQRGQKERTVTGRNGTLWVDPSRALEYGWMSYYLNYLYCFLHHEIFTANSSLEIFKPPCFIILHISAKIWRSMSFLQKLRFHIFPATPVILFGHPWIYLLLQVVLQASQTRKMPSCYWSFTCIDLNRISHYRRGPAG